MLFASIILMPLPLNVLLHFIQVRQTVNGEEGLPSPALLHFLYGREEVGILIKLLRNVLPSNF
jgi:hypothetical protein